MKSDLVIVGGGLVGLTLAAALKDWPGQVTLIESVSTVVQTTFDYDARSLALSRGSGLFLQQLDLWPMLIPYLTPILSIHVSEKKRFGKTRLYADEEKVPALGYVIEIPYLLAALQEKVKACENLTRIVPATVTDIKKQAQGWTLQLNHDGKEKTLTTRLVIAADGANSFLRNALNIPVKKKDYGYSAIITNISLTNSHDHIAYERFTLQGPVALLPLTQQRMALVWTMRQEELEQVLALPDKDFLARLQQHVGFHTGLFEKVGKRQSFPLRSIWVKQQVISDFILLGNAAHTLHPIAGQGFNLALRDIEGLENVLCNNEQFTQHDLDSYQKQRRRDQRRIRIVTDLLAYGFIPEFSPLTIARNASLAVFDHLRPIKHLFARMMMGL